jgi:hypothetical protein
MINSISKSFFAACMSGVMVLSGCGTSVSTLSNTEWQAQKESRVQKTATVFVANVDFRCKIISAASDKLVVQENGVNYDLPMEAVSKIVFEDDGNKGHPVLGGVIGGAVGIGVGYAVGHAAASTKSTKAGVGASLAHPLSIVCILGGAVSGVLIGSGRHQSEEFNFNKTLKPFVLHPEVGLEITPLELRSFSLFADLPANADEKILQVQIFQLSTGKYLLLYDVSYAESYFVKWRVVDQAYLDTEKAKIKTR